MLPPLVDRGQLMLRSQRDNPLPVVIQNRAREDKEGSRPLGRHGSKRTGIIVVLYRDDNQLNAEARGSLLSLLYLILGGRFPGREAGDPPRPRDGLSDQLQVLPSALRAGRVSYPGDISSRSREASDEAPSDRIGGEAHDYWDRLGCIPCCLNGAGADSDDDIRAKLHQFSCQFGEPIEAPVSMSQLDDQVLPFDIAEFAEAGNDDEGADRPNGREDADAIHLRRLLRFGDEGRGEDTRTHHGNERSPVHHWMISSARISTDCGIVSPRAFAVLRLITSSNLVGCSTGRSAGFAPLRILST